MFATPYASQSRTIGDLIRQSREAQAERIRRSGDIQAQMLSNLGNIAAGTIGSIVKERQEAPIRAEQQRIRALELSNAERQAANLRRADEDRSVMASAQSSQLPPEQVKAQLAQLGRGDLIPIYEKATGELETVRFNLSRLREQAKAAENDVLGVLALNVQRAKGDPIAIDWALSEAEKDGYDVGSIRTTLQQQPDMLPRILDGLITKSETARTILANEAKQKLDADKAEAERLDREADNKRLDLQLTETQRHNRATEAAAARQAAAAEARARTAAESARAEQQRAAAQAAGGGVSPYTLERNTRVRGVITRLLGEKQQDGSRKGGQLGNMNTGVIGRATVNLPSTPARKLAGDLNELKANIGFNELTEMRAASKTGGALGQVAVQELEMLQATLGSLDQFVDDKDLAARLENIESSLDRWEKAKIGAAQRQVTVTPTPTAVEYDWVGGRLVPRGGR